MYISRAIDWVVEANPGKHPPAGPLAKAARILGVGQPAPRRPLVSERAIEVPIVWKSIFALPPGSRILEVGCVGSEFPPSLIALGYEAHGIDIRPYDVNVDGYAFVNADASDLSMYPTDHFDFAFSVSVFEHMGLEVYGGAVDEAIPSRAAKELRRVAKPGSAILITVPFGRVATYSSYRVFDLSSVKSVFGPDAEVKTYAKGDRFGTWKPLGVDEAQKITYEAPGTAYPIECVACVTLRC